MLKECMRKTKDTAGLSPFLQFALPFCKSLTYRQVRFTFPFSGFKQNIWVHKRAGQTKKYVN